MTARMGVKLKGIVGIVVQMRVMIEGKCRMMAKMSGMMSGMASTVEWIVNRMNGIVVGMGWGSLGWRG